MNGDEPAPKSSASPAAEQNMDLSLWYVFGILTFPLYFFVKYVVLSSLAIPLWKMLRRRARAAWGFSIDANIRGVLAILALATANVFFTVFHSKTLPDFTRRTGIMMLINLIPLSVGSRVNWFLGLLHSEPNTVALVHRWIGHIAILEGLTHIALAMSQHLEHLQEFISTWDILSASALAAVAISALPFFRRTAYELFVISHAIFVALLSATLWHHVRDGGLFRVPRLYVFLLTCTWPLVRLSRLCFLLYRNTPRRGTGNRATLLALPDATLICVELTRPWTFRPGQYVYLTIPSSGTTGVLQSRPFFVAWWHALSEHGKDPSILVLIAATRRGFSRSLNNMADKRLLDDDMRELKGEPTPSPCWCVASLDPACRMSALIEGPFGHEVRLDPFRTVLFVASGIGITSVMSYLKCLAGASDHFQRIALYWEFQSEHHGYWVRPWMDEILERDNDKVT
ncbi:FAD-binding 8 [Penicillium occitanis (nom. inval.)]|nr:FAD-binding 8 [Penicillium occitanis (nom. inval.)]PCG89164.1 hypothetical protein PENOC_107700 [Penicillium occitanis (nom. inval.)]